MEFIIFWLATIITSFCLEIKNEFRMFKDVADAGYKINTKRLRESSESLDPNVRKISLMSMLIPVFNMMNVLQRVIQYNNVRPMVLDQLKVMNILEEMSEIEKIEYSKKRTSINAIVVPLKIESRLEKTHLLKVESENGISELYFEKGKLINDITILKVNGPASRLTSEEQKEIIIDEQRKKVDQILSDLNEITNILKALNTSDDITNKNEEQSQKLSIDEQMQKLIDLKNELLDAKSQENDDKDKGPKLRK